MQESDEAAWVLHPLVEQGWNSGVDIQHETFVSSCDELEMLENSEQRVGNLRRWR